MSGNDLQMLGGASVEDCGCDYWWTGCLVDEVGRIPVTLKRFIEVGFFSLSCYGVLQ